MVLGLRYSVLARSLNPLGRWHRDYSAHSSFRITSLLWKAGGDWPWGWSTSHHLSVALYAMEQIFDIASSLGKDPCQSARVSKMLKSKRHLLIYRNPGTLTENKQRAVSNKDSRFLEFRRPHDLMRQCFPPPRLYSSFSLILFLHLSSSHTQQNNEYCGYSTYGFDTPKPTRYKVQTR